MKKIRLDLLIFRHYARSALLSILTLGTLRHSSFDLIFMDCQMPRMDDYLTKPLRKQELADCVARWT